MKNKLAIKLVAAADKYRSGAHKSEAEEPNPKVTAIIESDYEDLIGIANMIEANENPKAIWKAMWDIDTLVRDVIPDEVYNQYCK